MQKRTMFDWGFAASVWATVAMVTMPLLMTQGAGAVDVAGDHAARLRMSKEQPPGRARTPHGTGRVDFARAFWRTVFGVEHVPGASGLVLEGDEVIAIEVPPGTSFEDVGPLDFEVARGAIVLAGTHGEPVVDAMLAELEGAPRPAFMHTTVELTVAYGTITTDRGAFEFTGFATRRSHVIMYDGDVDAATTRDLAPIAFGYYHSPDASGRASPAGGPGGVEAGVQAGGGATAPSLPCARFFIDPARDCGAAHRDCKACCWAKWGPADTLGRCVYSLLACLALAGGLCSPCGFLAAPLGLACFLRCVIAVGSVLCGARLINCIWQHRAEFEACIENCDIHARARACLPK